MNIILDPGSYRLKYGLSTDPEPKSVFSSIGVPFGELNSQIPHPTIQAFNWDPGLEAPSSETMWTIRKGRILREEYLGELFNYLFERDFPGYSSNEKTVLIAEPYLTTKRQREYLGQMIIEQNQFHGFYLANKGVLSILATGHKTGVAIHVGDSSMFVCPVYEGFAVQKGFQFSPFGGHHLIKGVFPNPKINLAPGENWKYFEPIMKFKCQELTVGPVTASHHHTIELTSHRSIQARNQFFQFPLKLIMGVPGEEKKQAGLKALFKDSADSLDTTCKNDIYRYASLSGGSVAFPGFASEIQKQIQNLQVETSSKPTDVIWKGGAILAKNPLYQEFFVTAEEWEEQGPIITERKCFDRAREDEEIPQISQKGWENPPFFT